jgi:tetratricopeptide (TPR) repeat protein
VATQQAGLAIDPLDAVAHRQLGRFQFGLGRMDEAEAATRRAIELQPAAPALQAWLVYIQVLRDNDDAALETARQIAPGGWRDTAMAMALSAGQDRTAADTALRRLIDAHAGENAFQIAEVHAFRGDADKAFEWLNRAHRSRDPAIQILMFDPFILRFRDDPRLAAFCRSVGLPPPSATDALGMDRIRARISASR